MLSFASWILPSKANSHRPDKGGFRDPPRYDDQPYESTPIDGDDVCGRTVVPSLLSGQAGVTTSSCVPSDETRRNRSQSSFNPAVPRDLRAPAGGRAGRGIGGAD